MQSFFRDQMIPSRLASLVCVLVLAAFISGCGADESALFCVEQAPGIDGIAVSNQCNDTIVVKADDGEKLIIAAGLTHQLLGPGKQLSACFAPKEPQIANQTFRCD